MLPWALRGLPEPSAVFIGGTGRWMKDILEHVADAAGAGCRVVINLATLENLHEALEVMRALGWLARVTQVSLAQGADIAGMTRLAPLNPVFIVAGEVS